MLADPIEQTGLETVEESLVVGNCTLGQKSFITLVPALRSALSSRKISSGLWAYTRNLFWMKNVSICRAKSVKRAWKSQEHGCIFVLSTFHFVNCYFI